MAVGTNNIVYATYRCLFDTSPSAIANCNTSFCENSCKSFKSTPVAGSCHLGWLVPRVGFNYEQKPGSTRVCWYCCQ